MREDPYFHLAQRLDALPEGFPAAEDGSHLELLQMIFTPEEAEVAAELTAEYETAEQIAARIGKEPSEIGEILKSLAEKENIYIRGGGGVASYALMPFFVGFYESQLEGMDAEFAGMFDRYYKNVFGKKMDEGPTYLRVIPVGESVRANIEIHPYESATDVVNSASSWVEADCICRKQKSLIGEQCDHPQDLCIGLSSLTNAFDGIEGVRVLTREEALAVLQRAEDAGLVHTTTNIKSNKELEFICNCCTCCCVSLRAVAEFGLANAISRSVFVNTVDENLCTGCGLCIEQCQFEALSMDVIAEVDDLRCMGCGVCFHSCPDGALVMERRSEEEILPIPKNYKTWGIERGEIRGKDLREVHWSKFIFPAGTNTEF